MDGDAVNGSPKMLARKLLARQLKHLREQAGLTQAQAANKIRTASTTISKIETWERNVPGPHLELMIQVYGVKAAHAMTLWELAKQAREAAWWESYGDNVPEWFVEFVGLETAAKQVDSYESEYVPGLLQIRDYTEALARGFNSAEPSDNGEGLVAVRTARQQRLAGGDLTLRAVLNEGALHRKVGGVDVMRRQLAWLREAAQRPNITLQILPFSVGPHPGMTGPFTILRFPDPSLDMVFIEIRGDGIYRDGATDVARHEADFERLCCLALGEGDTTRKLKEIEKEVL